MIALTNYAAGRCTFMAIIAAPQLRPIDGSAIAYQRLPTESAYSVNLSITANVSLVGAEIRIYEYKQYD